MSTTYHFTFEESHPSGTEREETCLFFNILWSEERIIPISHDLHHTLEWVSIVMNPSLRRTFFPEGQHY